MRAFFVLAAVLLHAVEGVQAEEVVHGDAVGEWDQLSDVRMVEQRVVLVEVSLVPGVAEVGVLDLGDLRVVLGRPFWVRDGDGRPDGGAGGLGAVEGGVDVTPVADIAAGASDGGCSADAPPPASGSSDSSDVVCIVLVVRLEDDRQRVGVVLDVVPQDDLASGCSGRAFSISVFMPVRAP